MEFYVFNVVENTGKIFVPTEHGELCERIDRHGGSFEQIQTCRAICRNFRTFT